MQDRVCRCLYDTRALQPKQDLHYKTPHHTTSIVEKQLQALQDPSKTCVVWINAGHEIFQEARAQTTTLLEQAISGYHEGNDVVYAMSHPEFVSGVAGGGTNVVSNSGGGTNGGALNGTRLSKSRQGSATNGRGSGVAPGGGGDGAGVGDTFEDGYINNVLSTMSDMQSEARHRARGNLLRAGDSDDDGGGDGGGGNARTLDTGGSKGTGQRGQGGGGGVENTNTDNTEMGSAWDGSVGEVYGSSWENYRSSVTIAGENAANRGGHFGNNGAGGASDEEERWRRHDGAGKGRRKGRRQHGSGRQGGGREGDGGAQGRNIMVGTVLDASHPAFERQDNLIYGFGQGSKVYPQPEAFPEVSGVVGCRGWYFDSMSHLRSPTRPNAT